MAGWKCRLACCHIGSEVFLMLVRQDAGVPCRDNVPTAVGILLDTLDDISNLVDAFVVPIAPLGTIDRSKVAVRVGPFVPNADLVVVQILDVGVATEQSQ